MKLIAQVHLLVFLFALIQSHFEQNDHFCGFDPNTPIIEMHPNGEKPPRPDANVAFTPFRIYYDYAYLDSQLWNSTATYLNSIKSLLEEAKSIFESIITFQRRKDIKAVGNSTCLNYTFSPIVKFPGVPADLIIIPSLDWTLNEGMIAAAGPCMMDDYPVMGIIKIQPNLPILQPNAMTFFAGVFIHEMTHILVFNPFYFPIFTDKAGLPYKQVTINKVVNGVNRTLIATPKVIEAAKRHFGCDSIEGVELESQGGSSTAGGHWAGRVMLGDYMIGNIYEEMFFSDITMALFEDSGWYKMNYFTGGQFKYGKGEGCAFLNQKCVVNNKSTNPKYYETTFKKAMCLQGRTSKGECDLNEKTEALPKEYQYFDNPKLGGFTLADFCPVALPLTSKTKYSIMNCKTGNLQYENYGEILSGMSNCFMSSLVESPIDLPITDKAICYPFRCDFFRNTTLLTVMRNEIECPTEGGNKTFAGFKGSIQCPRFDEMCTTQTPCFGVKDCVEKQSLTYYHTLRKEEGETLKGSFATLNIVCLVFSLVVVLG